MRDNRDQESARHLRSGYPAVVFLFHNFVALAREVLEAFAIQYANIAAMVIDKSVLSEAVRRDADAGPAHPQHSRKKFLSQRKGIADCTVVRHQQPPRQPLIQGV